MEGRLAPYQVQQGVYSGASPRGPRSSPAAWCENRIGITIFKDGGRAVGNVVRQNHVRRAPGNGIYVGGVPERTVVMRNHVFRAGADGIIVGNPNDADPHRGLEQPPSRYPWGQVDCGSDVA
jgi:hypothetical protein